MLSFLGRSQPRRAWKTRTSTKIWRIWLSAYDAATCTFSFALLFVKNVFFSSIKIKQNLNKIQTNKKMISPSSPLSERPHTHMRQLRFGSVSLLLSGDKWAILRVLHWAMYATYIKRHASCCCQSEWRPKTRRAMSEKKNILKLCFVIQMSWWLWWLH